MLSPQSPFLDRRRENAYAETPKALFVTLQIDSTHTHTPSLLPVFLLDLLVLLFYCSSAGGMTGIYLLHLTAVVIRMSETSVLTPGVKAFINSSNIGLLWTAALFGLRYVPG